jgi:hypothetical protein
MAIQPRTIQRVKEHARDSGIKDPVAQPVIERLLTLSKSLYKQAKDAPRRSTEEITAILRQELDRERRKGCMNPLLDMEGLFSCS